MLHFERYSKCYFERYILNATQSATYIERYLHFECY